MARRTVLEAAVEALRAAKGPRSPVELHAAIIRQGLYEFRAKDAVGVVRAALRRHVSTHGGPGQPVAQLRAVEHDRYVLPE
jgi:hypothetical protein